MLRWNHRWIKRFRLLECQWIRTSTTRCGHGPECHPVRPSDREAVRYGYTVEDLGDIPINREKINNDEELKNLNSVLSGNEKLAQKVNKVIEEKNSRLFWAVTTVLRSARWQHSEALR
ncbi:arginase [Bacillus tequilensis]|nr:arginase [Bacillus tequilensis]